MQHHPLDHVAGTDAYRRRTRHAALLLLLACVVLSGAAIGFAVPLTGLAALCLTFGGGAWLATRYLRARWARSMGVMPPR
jgi:uncharacterized membrane protein